MLTLFLFASFVLFIVVTHLCAEDDPEIQILGFLKCLLSVCFSLSMCGEFIIYSLYTVLVLNVTLPKKETKITRGVSKWYFKSPGSHFR